MKKIITATLILIISSPAYSEVFNCDGVYTNNPCNSKMDAKSATAPQKVIEDNQEAKKASSKKKSLMHDLSMRVYKVNKEYKLAYNTEIIEDYCKQETTSVIDCSTKVDELNGKIDDRIASLETIKAQKKANEIQEKKNDDVTIVQQVFIEPTPTFDPWDHGYRPKPVKRPKYDQDGRPIVYNPPVDKLQTYGRKKK